MVNFAYSELQNDIRASVRQLCMRFDLDYWRTCDEQRSYPADFVRAMSDAGWLGVLIPEEAFEYVDYLVVSVHSSFKMNKEEMKGMKKHKKVTKRGSQGGTGEKGCFARFPAFSLSRDPKKTGKFRRFQGPRLWVPRTPILTTFSTL